MGRLTEMVTAALADKPGATLQELIAVVSSKDKLFADGLLLHDYVHCLQRLRAEGKLKSKFNLKTFNDSVELVANG